MTNQHTRRDMLKGSLALAGLGIIGIPDWELPALAQGETAVPFTDIPEKVQWETPPDRRILDVRTIDGPFTPKNTFATTQHYGHPEVDPATYKLKVYHTRAFPWDDVFKHLLYRGFKVAVTSHKADLFIEAQR